MIMATWSEISTAKRRRRYPSAMSIHAFVVLLASCSIVDALISPPKTTRCSNNRWLQQSRYYYDAAPTLLAASRLATDGTSARKSIKGQQQKQQPNSNSSYNQPPSSKQRKRSKKQTTKKGKGKRSHKTKKSRIISSSTTTSAEPWNADYKTSIRTQRKIQAAARYNNNASSYNNNNNNNYDPVKTANAVLTTLLTSPPTECNAANIVCALTLSCKTLPRNNNKNNNNKQRTTLATASSTTTAAYQKSLLQTLSILSTLVTQNKLIPRQLCNAAWGIAKHVEYDDTLFAASRRRNDMLVVKNNGAKSTSWDLRRDKVAEEEDNMLLGNASSDKLIDGVLNLIALRMVEHLEETRLLTGGVDNNKQQAQNNNHNKPVVQAGELSMLLWAYAVAKPRDCPPGWEQPRRMEKKMLSGGDDGGLTVDGSSNTNSNNEKKNGMAEEEDEDLDFVTFVELEDDGSTGSSSSYSSRSNNSRRSSYNYNSNYNYNNLNSQDDDESYVSSMTSQLFNAAAIAFCQGEGAAVSIPSKQLVAGSNNIKNKDKQSQQQQQQPPPTLLKSCTWNELSNIAWSYATRGAYATPESEAMMAFFAKEATRRIRYCSRQAQFYENDDTNINNYKGGCNILPRDVIQIAWALGTMESDNVSIGDALVMLVGAIDEYWIGYNGQDNNRPLAKWTCADLVQMATALAHGRLDNQSVLMAVYEESLERLLLQSGSSNGNGNGRGKRGFSTREISILMWAQARLYLTSKFGSVYEEFPSVASRALLQRMVTDGGGRDSHNNNNNSLLSAAVMHQKGLGPQEQANLAWSLTVLENYDASVVSLLQNIFHAASSSKNGDSDDGDGDDKGIIIQLEHAHQLWQSYFLLSKDCPDAVKYVPTEFSQYLEEKWNIEKSRSKTSSSRHRAISQTLSLMRVAHRNEYDEDVDVAIVLDSNSAWTHMAEEDIDYVINNNSHTDKNHMKVAVEFDGPHHFTVMASTEEDLALIENGEKIKPRVLGHTVLKYRLLKKKGWTVVRIPYYEFDKIPFWASMERQRYLQRALKTHDKIEFSVVDISEYKAMPTTRHSRFD